MPLEGIMAAHDYLRIVRRVGRYTIEIVAEWNLGTQMFAMRGYLDGRLVRSTSSDNLMSDAVTMLDEVAIEIESAKALL